jgi:hypothetical protein
LASPLGIHKSQVTVWKKQLMGHVAELIADVRQPRGEQASVEQEPYDQIGRLKMEVRWLKKSCRGRLKQASMHRAQPRTPERLTPIRDDRPFAEQLAPGRRLAGHEGSLGKYVDFSFNERLHQPLPNRRTAEGYRGLLSGAEKPHQFSSKPPDPACQTAG